MPKLGIGTATGPVTFKKLSIGDIGGPKRIKKLYIGDSGSPKLIFSEGLPDGYMYDFNATIGQYNQPEVGYIINSVNGAPSAIQPYHLVLGGGSTWGLSSLGGRKQSFNNNSVHCGRGGTFRFPNPVNNATLLLVQRLNTDVLTNDSFTNTCNFNQIGEYRYASDYFYYTGAEISNLSFRKENTSFQVTGGNSLAWINKQIAFYWMYTVGNTVYYRIRAMDGNVWTHSVAKTNSVPVQDVRVCDWGGGGVEALTGELFQFTIWNRDLTNEEIADSENFLIEKWQ